MSLAQKVTKATSETKIRYAILCTALSDALGGSTEFHARFSFAPVTSMQPNDNFGLPKGVWTDDTSMALCLARSISSAKDFDEEDQLAAYTKWWRDGTLSATGRCFDIGNTIRQAVRIYHESPGTGALLTVQKTLKGSAFSGNGSLMRVIPIGVLYWRDEEKARELARRSSTTTHPNEMCQEACEVWTGAICRVMQAATSTAGRNMSKLDVLAYFATFPYRDANLRTSLAYIGTGDLEREHPLMQIIHGMTDDELPSTTVLPSSGYVLHTIVAALFCFLSTDTFEAGAMRAANLGSDADTVAAIYGGLAGCWYGTDDTVTSFWTPRVDAWCKDLVKKDLIKAVTEELIGKEQSFVA